mmetsp:Transcript_3257/g.5993  ORF Transcript_3257/g.5993 Transcript_3257/m.5993 type:complete len:272 (-) Transcript_3257:948-1763(-)
MSSSTNKAEVVFSAAPTASIFTSLPVSLPPSCSRHVPFGSTGNRRAAARSKSLWRPLGMKTSDESSPFSIASPGSPCLISSSSLYPVSTQSFGSDLQSFFFVIGDGGRVDQVVSAGFSRASSSETLVVIASSSSAGSGTSACSSITSLLYFVGRELPSGRMPSLSCTCPPALFCTSTLPIFSSVGPGAPTSSSVPTQTEPSSIFCILESVSPLCPTPAVNQLTDQSLAAIFGVDSSAPRFDFVELDGNFADMFVMRRPMIIAPADSFLVPL